MNIITIGTYKNHMIGATRLNTTTPHIVFKPNTREYWLEPLEEKLKENPDYEFTCDDGLVVRIGDLTNIFAQINRLNLLMLAE